MDDIPQVDIWPKTKKFKKISPKTQRLTEKYLSEKGLSLDDLTDGQQKHLLEFFKSKRINKLLILVMVICGLAFGIMSIQMFKLFTKISTNVAPQSLTVIMEDGTEKTSELIPEDKKHIILYGNMCMISGGLLATALYSLGGIFGSITGTIITTRHSKKIFDAFLPAVAENTKTKSQSDL